MYERVYAHSAHNGVLKIRGDHRIHFGLSDVRALLEYDETTCQTIASFLQRAWFHRLWIWQVIGLAKPDALLVCGLDIMPCSHLSNFLRCLYAGVDLAKASGEVKSFDKLISNAFRLSEQCGTRSITSLRFRTNNALCADPRDRVYGIIRLACKSGPLVELRLDCNKSVAEVYLDFTIHAIKVSRTLSVLHLIRTRTKQRSVAGPALYVGGPHHRGCWNL